MDLTFNIIFVPGTVRYLRLAILSLLKYSNYRYRLISNGLDRSELALLKEFCRSDERLEFYAYPSKTVLAHGTLLSLLQSRERGEFFAFMDSDIFASAPFQPELESHLADCDVFSSCSHLGQDPAEPLIGLEGRCLAAPNGLALATTFFCVYRNEPLRRVIAETGVGFERHSCANHFPESVADFLRHTGLPADAEYDTGKLLSVLAHANHLRFQYEFISGLTHIGGIGKYIMKSSWSLSWQKRLGRWTQRPFVLRDENLEPQKRNLSDLLSGKRSRSAELANPARRAERRAKLLRRHVAFYFTALFRSLFDGGPEPVLAITDPALVERIQSLCTVIHTLFQDRDWKLAA